MLRDNLEFNKSVKPNSDFLEELKQKLPEFFTAEKYDEDGKLLEESFFDIEKFKVALQEKNINELSSGYQLDFIGKNYAKKQSGERPTTVIVPDNVYNSKPENTSSKNVFLTGDNLEVLRHLQQNYTNSIDVIYIDPPYNTGNGDFIYPDKFEYSDDALVTMFGLNDSELKRLKSIQGKSTHSSWLTFIYPRLYLAKKLLKANGMIFVSIDDNEQANLKLMMDEIFGENSLMQEIVWRRTDNQPNIGASAKVKEYILVYAKDKGSIKYGRLPLSESALREYRYEDDYAGKFRRGILLHKTRGRHSYPVTTKSGKILLGPWMVTQEQFKKLDEENQIYWTSGGDEQPYSKIYLKDSNGAIPNDFWGIEYGTNQRASLEVEALFNARMFDFPKPVSLIKALLNLGTNQSSIVLDFFAGSGTTAHAVMQLNSEDGGNRRFIMCTLPEPTFILNSDGSEQPTKGGKVAYDAGYRSIDEISRERICRAAAKIQEENPLLSESQDFGFKHYRVVAPAQETMESIEYSNSMQLDLFDDMISKFSSESLGVGGQASGQDTILQTYLVKDGYKFDANVEWIDMDGVKVPYVEGQRMYIISNSWETQNTRALINAIGTNQIRVQTIVVYGHSIEMAHYRELEIALAQLEIRPNLQVRY